MSGVCSQETSVARQEILIANASYEDGVVVELTWSFVP